MTLQFIIKTLQDIALLQPNVNSCGNGDIYNFINGNPQTKYSVFFITQGTHREENSVDYYNLNLFYLDRLMQDKKNNLQIQSTAKECLSNIIKSLCETFDVEVNTQINYTPFTETFSNDLCSGVYCNLTFEVVQDTTCAEQYGEFVKPIIKIINNQDITITENGTYFPQEGYSGFGKVDVNIDTDSFYQEGYEEGFSKGETEGYNEGYSEGEVNGREQQKSLLESIKITENGVYDNENGYDVVDVEIDTSGAYNEGFDKGKAEGVEQGKEEGKAEQKALIQSITITENGVYSNENGYSPIDVKLDTESYYNNGYNEGFSKGETEGYETGYNEGYSEGEVNGVEQGKAEQKALLESITIKENGVYTNENGYDEVIVDVPTGGGEGDYEEGYNKGYEEGVANAEEEIAETAQVLRITENGRYTTKYTDVSDSDRVVKGYFDDGTPFYNYGLCNKISYDTGIKVTPTTKLEVWYMSDKWAGESDTAIVATQNSANYNAIFKIIKHYANIKAEISQQSISAPNPMVNGEWYHLKLSFEEGFWINDEFVGYITRNVTEPTFNLCINSFLPNNTTNYSSNAYFGMIKIDNQIIIPTEQGFYNVTTDSYLQSNNNQNGVYVYTEAKSDFTGNLIKEVIVEVPTGGGSEGEYTQEEVDEMCASVYEASSQILDYLNSTGENVEYTITENGHHSFEADTYFNEVTINIKVPTSSGEDALHNFNDLGYQTDDVVYMGNPATMKDDLDYSYTKKIEFDGSTNYFNNDTQLVYAPYINFEGVESDSLDSFFAGCENMLCVPKYNLWWETHYVDRFFENCSKLKSFEITSTYIDSIHYMCSNCVNLNELSIYSDSESIGAEGAFYNCHNLEYIPQIGSLGEFNLINSDTFYSCFKLKKIENIINSWGTIYDFVYCYSLEDVKIKLNDSGDFAIDLSYSHKLKWDCVKFLIDNAEEGYSHTIKLHSSLEEKYHQESDFETYMTMAEERGITFEYVSIEIPTEYL